MYSVVILEKKHIMESIQNYGRILNKLLKEFFIYHIYLHEF